MGGRERNPVIARGLNDDRGRGFGGESVHRLQFHHAMAEGANDAPATGGGAQRHR